MADRPLSAPLPADLPEDWTDGQIVAPSGGAVGLSEQHGYNYLMAMVNRAQEAVNAINESFDNISGKRTCRLVVGTSTAGWTQADCDYLCDGTDDQVEIQQALDSITSGTVILLNGSYYLSGPLTINGRKCLTGSGTDTTNLYLKEGAFSGDSNAAIICNGSLTHIALHDEFRESTGGRAIVHSISSPMIADVLFWASGGSAICISCEHQEGSSSPVDIYRCSFHPGGGAPCFSFSGGYSTLNFIGNQIFNGGEIQITNDSSFISKIYMLGNASTHPPSITISAATGGGVISGNMIERLKLLNGSKGFLVTGNNFNSVNVGPCVSLDAEAKYNFIAGNTFFNPTYGTQRPVEDLGVGNIIRFNSNDAGSGGGSSQGVSSFNGRTGAVAPALGDYTAAMVGSIPSGDVAAVKSVTQAQYDALSTKDPTTLYLIRG